MSEGLLLPLALDLRGRSIVVSGESSHAREKIKLLISSGANLRIYSSLSDPNIDEFKDSVEWRSLPVEPPDVRDAFLIVYVGEDKAEAARLFELAESQAKFICCVDDPPHCNVIFPAIARSGKVQVAVSTSGLSPTLARKIKDQIQNDILGRDVGAFAEFLGRARANINGQLSGFARKKDFWEKVLETDIRKILELQGEEAAMQAVVKMLQNEPIA
ncbi:MAG: bifunctional precorrin-2 dehydrogenase/sirohydrochlorin ferrochelatase [Spirochaetia bacterium]|nr:bifunctional precorrin-2 dehydrogenase/sirohydrochlorin ferrochelatase [Spirochaetia bacterium]